MAKCINEGCDNVAERRVALHTDLGVEPQKYWDLCLKCSQQMALRGSTVIKPKKD